MGLSYYTVRITKYNDLPLKEEARFINTITHKKILGWIDKKKEKL